MDDYSVRLDVDTFSWMRINRRFANVVDDVTGENRQIFRTSTFNCNVGELSQGSFQLGAKHGGIWIDRQTPQGTSNLAQQVFEFGKDSVISSIRLYTIANHNEL